MKGTYLTTNDAMYNKKELSEALIEIKVCETCSSKQVK